MRKTLIVALSLLGATACNKLPSASGAERTHLANEIAKSQRAILLATPIEVKYFGGDPPKEYTKLEVPEASGTEIDVRSSTSMLSLNGGNWQFPTIAVVSAFKYDDVKKEFGPQLQTRWASSEWCPQLVRELKIFERTLNHRFLFSSLHRNRGSQVFDGDTYTVNAMGEFSGHGNPAWIRLTASTGSPVATQMEKTLVRLNGCFRQIPVGN